MRPPERLSTIQTSYGWDAEDGRTTNVTSGTEIKNSGGSLEDGPVNRVGEISEYHGEALIFEMLTKLVRQDSNVKILVQVQVSQQDIPRVTRRELPAN